MKIMCWRIFRDGLFEIIVLFEAIDTGIKVNNKGVCRKEIRDEEILLENIYKELGVTNFY